MNNERLVLKVGDKIRITGSMFNQHNTIGTVVVATYEDWKGEIGIEFTDEYGSYQYWKSWADGGKVELLDDKKG